jgi:hypothetical protein
MQASSKRERHSRNNDQNDENSMSSWSSARQVGMGESRSSVPTEGRRLSLGRSTAMLNQRQNKHAQGINMVPVEYLIIAEPLLTIETACLRSQYPTG